MREPSAAARTSAPRFPIPSNSPMTEQVVLGFDFGTRRVGVSLGNSIARHARPLEVIAAPTAAARWEAITALVEQWRPGRIVVGLPRHPDGAEHEMTHRSQRFGRQLAGRYGVPVVFVDERYSSAVLEHKNTSDADAAAVILQQWFDANDEGKE